MGAQVGIELFEVEGKVLDAALAEFDVVKTNRVADRAPVFAGNREHVVVHVHANDAPGRPDHLRRDETDLSRPAAEIEDRLARLQIARRVTTTVVALDDFRGITFKYSLLYSTGQQRASTRACAAPL
jgi:hypothetical protein